MTTFCHREMIMGRNAMWGCVVLVAVVAGWVGGAGAQQQPGQRSMVAVSPVANGLAVIYSDGDVVVWADPMELPLPWVGRRVANISGR